MRNNAGRMQPSAMTAYQNVDIKQSANPCNVNCEQFASVYLQILLSTISKMVSAAIYKLC